MHTVTHSIEPAVARSSLPSTICAISMIVGIAALALRSIHNSVGNPPRSDCDGWAKAALNIAVIGAAGSAILLTLAVGGIQHFYTRIQNIG